MEVREAMSTVVLTIGPDRTLRDAARQMAERNVGAAIVLDPDSPGPGIITERDVLRAVASSEDHDTELVRDHMSDDVISAAPDWGLDRAADVMIEHNFRHLLVVDGSEVMGVLSMRDIVRHWTRTQV